MLRSYMIGGVARQFVLGGPVEELGSAWVPHYSVISFSLHRTVSVKRTHTRISSASVNSSSSPTSLPWSKHVRHVNTTSVYRSPTSRAALFWPGGPW